MAAPASDPTDSHRETDSNEPPPAAVIEGYEALWNGDYSKLGVVAETATVYDPAAPDGVVQGRDAVEAHIRETFRGFPDFTLETHEMVIERDTVMLDWTATGSFEGEFYGAPPTGRTFNVSGMAKTVIEDGEVVHDRIVYDLQAMYAQLGVTFPDILFLLPRMIAAKVRGFL